MLSIFCAVLALLWVPATSHCEVSEILGLGHGQDGEHSRDCSDHPSAPPGCDHCSLCQTLDGGVITTSLDHPDFKPVLLPVFSFSGDAAAVFVDEVRPPEASPPPPRDLSPASWQFLQRTALAPRAPSLAS